MGKNTKIASSNGAQSKAKDKKTNRKQSDNEKKPPTPQNPTLTAKLKILCLHGYRQNEKTFREKTGAFRKAVGKHVDLTYITAPHAVPPMTPDDANQVKYQRLFCMNIK